MANSSSILIGVLGGSGSTSGADQLLAAANQASAARDTGADNATALLTEQIEQLRAANQVQAGIVADNTKAVTSNTTTQSTTGGTFQSVTDAMSEMNKSSFAVSPLISGLVKLFGGGGDSGTPPPLMTYTPPEAVRFEGQVSRSGNTTDWSGSEGTRSGTPVVSSAPQITVQVNAMDSQSFLDHSQEIAMAVREAMLNSHSLNDVVSDL